MTLPQDTVCTWNLRLKHHGPVLLCLHASRRQVGTLRRTVRLYVGRKSCPTAKEVSPALPSRGLSWCLRGLGLHPVPGTWIVREDLSLVQFELYQGTGWNPPSPWILKHQLSPCVVDNTTRHVYSCICVQDRVVNSCLHRHVLRTKSIVQALHACLSPLVRASVRGIWS